MNAKNRKILIILVLAVIVAVIGGVALYLYLTPKKTTVYMFKQNVKAGEVLMEDMLMAVQADSKIFVAGAGSDISSRFVTSENIDAVLKSGDSLRMDVTSGMPLVLSLLTAYGGSTVEMTMDPSKIAISIPMDNISGVTGDLKAGSRVNVYATGVDTDGVYKTILLFQNMRIIAAPKGGNDALTSVTIEVTVEESLKLVYYSSAFNICLGIIDSTGYQYSTDDYPSFAPGSSNNYSGSYGYAEGAEEDTILEIE